MEKQINLAIELNDGIKIIDGLNVILNAMKEISTKAEMPGGGVIEWDLSKNVPGYSMKMRDEGVNVPKKFIVGKAKRVHGAEKE